MFLKVMVCDEQVPKRHWYLFSDIQQTSVVYVVDEDLSNWELEDTEYTRYIICAKNKRKVSYAVLHCRRSNGSEFSVVFDTEAFIMGDDGKTIEVVHSRLWDR